MPTGRGGQFTVTINSEELARGLRPSKRVPVNSRFLVDCEGAVALDGVLQVLQDLSLDQVDITTLGAQTFPYPQLFILSNYMIVCTPTKIYEFDGANLTLKLTVASGSTWELADFNEYIYLSNGTVSVERTAYNGIYQLLLNQPIANAICNYNGQVLVGAPTTD